MKRLFFLVPDLVMTKSMVQELEAYGIEERDIHIVGNREATRNLKRENLPEANIVQTSDLMPALKRGALIGIFFSIVLFIVFYLSLPAEIHIKPIALVAILFFGIVFGSWTSTLIGVSVNDPIVHKHEKYLKEGHFILMIDCDDAKEKEIIQLVLAHYPDAELAGISEI
jgi:hypothetical protein